MKDQDILRYMKIVGIVFADRYALTPKSKETEKETSRAYIRRKYD